MVTAANRGKEAEKLFHAILDKVSAGKQDFDFERIDDARSSSGHMSKPRTGDFIVFMRGLSWAIEVKQVQHEFRLPRANFPRDQRARLRKRQLAGGIPVLFVYFATLQKWRMCSDLGFLGFEDTGSWDLTTFPLLDRNLPTLYDLLLGIPYNANNL